MKEVRVMFDYAAKPPLWGPGGDALRSSEHLDPELSDALNSWVDRGEQLIRQSWVDGTDDDPPSAERIAWNEEGRRLAARVRRSLGNDFLVSYWDEVSDREVLVDWD